MQTPIQRLALVTDAWTLQINGVVTTLQQMVHHLQQKGITVEVFHPYRYRHVPTPGYAEIPLVWHARGFKQALLAFQPDAVHIATEGPLGWRARRLCFQQGWPFTTAYHTRFPEYIQTRLPLLPTR